MSIVLLSVHCAHFTAPALLLPLLLFLLLLLPRGCCHCCCWYQVVPVVAQKKVEAGGFWVLRPDSGDPVDVVLQVRCCWC